MLKPLLSAARPKQWLKNVLVFAAPGAAGVLDQSHELGLTLLAFASFCCAASGIYMWNDLLDVEADRRHPTKHRRAIASGELSITAARVAGVVLPIAALGLAALTGRWETVAVVATYIAITIAYTLWLKHVPVVDVVTVAAGFVLRAAAGAVAVDVPMSRWFVLCVTFGSLFIVVGKRYAELNELGDDAGTRATLEEYSLGYLRMLLSMSLAGVFISYCVWAFETAEASASDLPLYELSIVPMLMALMRYLLVLDQGGGSAPEEVFARDRLLQLLGLCWVVVYGFAVYVS
ncbi:MAG: decaprenyl-phosphate phosphoribosyltransferase [Ilumatobacteraceae bacterium]